MLCLVFDIDDTIVEYVDFDFEEWYRMVAYPAAEMLGVEMTEEIWRDIISGRISRRYPEKFGVPYREFWRAVDRNNLRYRMYMVRRNRIRLYEDAKSIADLDGFKIAWSSSSEECVRYLLRILDFEGVFDAIYGKDYRDYALIDGIKPNSGLLLEIKRNHRCDECYVIGDSMVDMYAAKGGGCVGVLVDRYGNRGYSPRIRSLHELEDFLTAMRQR